MTHNNGNLTHNMPINDPKMALFELCNHMESIAAEHAAMLGLSIEKLLSEGIAWVLAKMHIEISRMPQGEGNTLYTWPVKISKAQFRRDFKVTDATGETIVTAATEWVIVDVKTRKISRIPDFVRAIHPDNAIYALSESNYKFSTPSDALALRITHANEDDIDINNHVNNVRYIKWIERALPKDLEIQAFEIVYKTEAFLGDKITAQGCSEGSAFLISLCRDGKELVKARINGTPTQ